ncbi:M24 family metallopeptidase [Streptomyces sp. NPDC054796]
MTERSAPAPGADLGAGPDHPVPAPPAFPAEEYAERRAGVRAAMARDGFGALLVTAPEDVHYLSGLDHQGHFAVTGLLLPLEGTPVLVEREMEAPTAAAQTHGCAHVGYGDGTDPADALLDALRDLAPLPGIPGRSGIPGTLGYQAASLSLPPAVWDRLREGFRERGPSGTRWADCGPLLTGCRSVHTPRETEHIRTAARLSDLAMGAGLAAATAGARENEVAAAVHEAMLSAGGGLPAFAPLVRTTDRLDQEHLTWSTRRIGPDDAVFLELSAAYGRYHAPLARLRHLGQDTAARDARAAEASHEAMAALCAALRPGETAEGVFHAWRSVMDRAVGGTYRRHHCGYLVGIGFPPGWMGGSRTLRPGNTMVLRAGMTLHIQSWMLDAHVGRHALSDTALVTDDGCEVLTRTPR